MHCGYQLECFLLGYEKEEEKEKEEEEEEAVARYVTQLIECLSSTHKAHGIKFWHDVTYIDPSTLQLGQEDQQFIENSRPIWVRDLKKLIIIIITTTEKTNKRD